MQSPWPVTALFAIVDVAVAVDTGVIPFWIIDRSMFVYTLLKSLLS